MASMVSIFMASGLMKFIIEILYSMRYSVLVLVCNMDTMSLYFFHFFLLLMSPVSCLLTKMTPFVRGQWQITWSYLAAGMTVLANHSRINIAQLLVSVPLVLSRV